MTPIPATLAALAAAFMTGVFALTAHASPPATASEPGGEFFGHVGTEISEQRFDLSVEDVNAKGGTGTETTVVIEVANAGPARAVPSWKSTGPYAVLGDLPTGLELVAVGDEGWHCPESAEWPRLLPATDPARLAEADFACFFFADLPAGAVKALPVLVRITGTESAADGSLTVATRTTGDDPLDFDADRSNDEAGFGLDVAASGGPPPTGASMRILLGGAGAALAASAVAALACRGRRIPTAD
ncbi:hypothetical protein [Glycomyces dulcitolivorans]|uniref:hypothetical protein n=1 Tax=Glycomyces dulcitolivorans TaxID=2200759 RepID=UPI000DD4C362|nr:hypothetical protein [Glycomyces dulcitolivorans]